MNDNEKLVTPQQKERYDRFVKRLVKLEPLEMAGIAYAFGVPLVVDNSNPEEESISRAPEDILVDILHVFIDSTTEKQKAWLKILKSSSSGINISRPRRRKKKNKR